MSQEGGLAGVGRGKGSADGVMAVGFPVLSAVAPARRLRFDPSLLPSSLLSATDSHAYVHLDLCLCGGAVVCVDGALPGSSSPPGPLFTLRSLCQPRVGVSSVKRLVLAPCVHSHTRPHSSAPDLGVCPNRAPCLLCIFLYLSMDMCNR